MSQSKRPEPPVLKRQGFTVRERWFGVEGGSRVGGARLRELFNPQNLRIKRDQKHATEEAKKLFSKPFFAAQLRYYAIKFPSNYRIDQLKNLLKESVSAGKVTFCPPPPNDDLY